jgi:hypothetical protein
MDASFESTPNRQRHQSKKKKLKRGIHFPVVDPQRVKPAPNRLRQAYGFFDGAPLT